MLKRGGCAAPGAAAKGNGFAELLRRLLMKNFVVRGGRGRWVVALRVGHPKHRLAVLTTNQLPAGLVRDGQDLPAAKVRANQLARHSRVSRNLIGQSAPELFTFARFATTLPPARAVSPHRWRRRRRRRRRGWRFRTRLATVGAGPVFPRPDRSGKACRADRRPGTSSSSPAGSSANTFRQGSACRSSVPERIHRPSGTRAGTARTPAPPSRPRRRSIARGTTPCC